MEVGAAVTRAHAHLILSHPSVWESGTVTKQQHRLLGGFWLDMDSIQAFLSALPPETIISIIKGKTLSDQETSANILEDGKQMEQW